MGAVEEGLPNAALLDDVFRHPQAPVLPGEARRGEEKDPKTRKEKKDKYVQNGSSSLET